MKRLLSCLFLAFGALVTLPLNAQKAQAKEFSNNNYRMKFLAKNELGKAYGRALEERAGLRELSIQGKVYLRQYRFEMQRPPYVTVASKPNLEYHFDGKNFRTKAMMSDSKTEKELAEITTSAVFSESSYTVTHSMRPLEDFTISPFSLPEEMIAMPIENVTLANVTSWTGRGKMTAIFPAICQKENWSMNGSFNKLEFRINDTVITISGNEKTEIKLEYLANLANNNLWKNPVIKIKPAHWKIRDAGNLKKDVPRVWEYTVTIEKLK